MKDLVEVSYSLEMIDNIRKAFTKPGMTFLGYLEVTQEAIDKGYYYLGIMFSEMKLYKLKDYAWEVIYRGHTGKYVFMYKVTGKEDELPEPEREFERKWTGNTYEMIPVNKVSKKLLE
jgi:hypothetical protein